MSEGVNASPNGAHTRFKIRNPQDFYGGVVLVGLALIALWATRDLPGMHGFAFGPGTAPRMFAVLLMAMGFVIMAIGVWTDGPKVGRYAFRGPVLVVAAVMVFATTIRPLGLVISSFVSIVIAASAAEDVRWVESLIWAVILTVFCSLLFPYALGLPLYLWPRI
jgi:putative tricarboxylic transport membrane protein